MSLYRCDIVKPGWSQACEDALIGASVKEGHGWDGEAHLLQRMVEVIAPLGSFGVIPGGIHAPSLLCGLHIRHCG